MPIFRLAAELAEVAACRHFVREQTAGCTDRVRDAAVLLTSELVTNALAGGRPGGEFGLGWGGGTLRLEVRYRNRPGSITPVCRIESLLGEEIVASLSDEWGIERTRSCERVWARIDLESR